MAVSDDAEVVFDDVRVRGLLEGLNSRTEEAVNHSRRVLGFLSAIVFEDIMRHFEQELGPEGPWQPWSMTYRQYLDRLGKAGNKILQDTGRLRQSFQPTNVKSTPEGFLWYNNARTGSGYPYASVHNYGRDRMPERRFMWLSSQAREKAVHQLLEFLISEKNPFGV